jgi:phosphomannomutase
MIGLMDEVIFKAYDVRGIYPGEINEPAVKRIAQAYAKLYQPKVVAVGRDVRLSGDRLQSAVIEGLIESGVDVVDIGIAPTELIYFAVGYYHYDGGIQVSASHNPAEYNGLKMIKAGVEPVSADSGLGEIKALATSDDDLSAPTTGRLISRDPTEDYLDFLTQFADFNYQQKIKIVANANFGASGQLAAKLLIRLQTNNVELVPLKF